MDELIRQSLEVTDQTARKEIYKEIVKKTMELTPALYYSNNNLLWGTTDKVHGCARKPTGTSATAR